MTLADGDMVGSVREVAWIEEGAMGSGEAHGVGTVAELLLGGPYPSLTPPEVPTIEVVNEMLGRPGGAGMNGGRRWEPLTLDLREYRDLVADLVASRGFITVDVPAWVTTRDDWHVWILERRRGVPAEPQRMLRQRALELTERFEAARTDPSTPPTRLASLFLAAKRAEDDALHFKDPWLMAPRYSKYRRTMRRLLDARNRRLAGEMAGDPAAAAIAAVECEQLRERCRPARPNNLWPVEWEDWPDYPPPESDGPPSF